LVTVARTSYLEDAGDCVFADMDQAIWVYGLVL
jgi:hypothetical protein